MTKQYNVRSGKSGVVVTTNETTDKELNMEIRQRIKISDSASVVICNQNLDAIVRDGNDLYFHYPTHCIVVTFETEESLKNAMEQTGFQNETVIRKDNWT